MTTMNEMTAGAFFAPNPSNLALRLATGSDSSPELSSLKSAFSRKPGSLAFGKIIASTADKVRDLLDIRLTEIMVRAWNQSQQIREAIEQTKESEGETVLLPLVEHTIESEHRPSIELRQGRETIGKVVFRMKLALHVEGVQIKIEQGKIREILSGQVNAQGTVKVGDLKILEKDFEPVPIRGSIAVEERTTARVDQRSGADFAPSSNGTAAGSSPNFAIVS